MSESVATRLPEWNLADLYESRDAPALSGDLDRAQALAQSFVARYRGRLSGLDGAGLARAIQDFEQIDETVSRVLSFAQLLHAGNRADPELSRFSQSVSERATDISAPLVFFTLDLNAIDDVTLERQMRHSDAARYRVWIERQRSFRPHQLAEGEERLLFDKHMTGRTAWTRLFDETMATLSVPFRDRQCGVTEILNLMVDHDADTRRDAGRAMSACLTEHSRVFTLITNTLAKDKEIEDRWRRLPRPISSRNLANHVEDAVVDALVGAVRGQYGALSHRYYRLKARWMGRDRLDWWDRNAPLPDASDRVIPWDEARAMVLNAYSEFSPELGAQANRFFDNAWIDAPIRPGKAQGAFAHPTVPSIHPYLLLNYAGKTRDVMTLAHELGHGVHQVLAGSAQGHLLADTPLTLAETASVFGEMLTFRALLDRETDPVRRRVLLAGKVEDMLNTVVRQIALLQFEIEIHDARRRGEVSAERLGEIWLTTQRESLGDAIRLDDDYAPFWAYIPHFIHSPFYVYAYAFGDCLVNALYAAYLDDGRGFAGRYLDVLRSGGAKHHRDLLAPFGLNAADPGFWARGLSVIAGFIDELERDIEAHGG